MLVLPPARSPRSGNNRGTLNVDLAAIYSQLVQTNVNVESIMPLLEQVTTKLASDLDIQNAKNVPRTATDFRNNAVELPASTLLC